MKPIDAQECQVNVFVCTHQREGRSACAQVGGQERYLELKNRVKALGLYNTHWVSRTGCLGFCNDVGTTIAIFRPGQPAQWQNEVTAEDLPKVWEEITK